MKNLKKNQGGFTLIEILVVIGIIAVLAAVVLIAINPARQFAQARESQRTANVNAILNAVGQNIADNAGIFTCDVDAYELPDAATVIASTGGEDIAECLVPNYMPALPFDPSDEDASWTDESNYDTGYTIEVLDSGRLEVCAPETEPTVGRTTPLCVTR